jgi:hypothetical protein
VVVRVRGLLRFIAAFALSVFPSPRGLVSLAGLGAVTYGTYLVWGEGAAWLVFGSLLLVDAFATAAFERGGE